MSSEILKRDQNHITVLGGVTNDADEDVIMLRVDPITKRLLVAATGIIPGFTELDTVSTIDGNNTEFVFTSKPTYIVSDGAWYRENMGFTWNSLTLTATMSVPPQFDIWGFN